MVSATQIRPNFSRVIGDEPLPVRVERALAAVLDAPDPRTLAEEVCRGIGSVLDVDRVVMLTTGPHGQREIARFERTGPSAGPDSPTTVLPFASLGVRTVVTVDAVIPDPELESARLLLEVAATAAERFATDDAVREQQGRLRSLVDELRGRGSLEGGGHLAIVGGGYVGERAGLAALAHDDPVGGDRNRQRVHHRRHR